MKKKLNVALIIVVVSLWGTVLYRYVGNYFGKDEMMAASQSYNTGSHNLDISRDTFNLTPLHYDPFLRTVHSAKVKSTVVNSRYSKKMVKIQQPVQPQVFPEPEIIPDIKYFGYIKSGSCDETALLKINGILVRVAKGQTKQGVTVKSCKKNTTVIVYSNKEIVLNKF